MSEFDGWNKATRDLMGNFYDQYWDTNQDEECLSTIQCLRNSQLALLNEKQSRGRLGKKIIPDPNARTAPFYWAAFVLTGNWE
ncbi:CHAT domain-containing protein [Planctomycetaceae bacterium SH139]